MRYLRVLTITMAAAVAALLFAAPQINAAGPLIIHADAAVHSIFEPAQAVMISAEAGAYRWTAESDGVISVQVRGEPYVMGEMFAADATAETVFWASADAGGVHDFIIPRDGITWIIITSTVYPVQFSIEGGAQ